MENQETHETTSEIINSYVTTDYSCMLCNSILYASLGNQFKNLIMNKLVDGLAVRVFKHSVEFDTKSSSQKIQNLYAHWDESIPSSTINELGKKIKYYTELDDFKEITKLGTILNTWMNNTLFKYYVNQYTNSHNNLDRLLKDVQELKLKPLSQLPVTDLGSIEEDKLLELTGEGNLIPSAFPFINETMDTGAYLKGTIVCVAAAPGKGKTNFLVQEIYHKVKFLGKKVYWLAMGDMMEVDFISRFGALFFNVSQKDVMQNVIEYYNQPEFRDFLKNIHTSILPSATISSGEFIESIDDHIAKMGEGYDIIVVDYDANFADTDESSSMYGAHKVIYNNLVRLAKNNPRKLIFVASQIKNQFYEESIIPLDALAESSYKQNIIDVLITLSRFTTDSYNAEKHKTEPINYGFINIAKLRRGSGRASGYISTPAGLLEPKTKSEIEMMIGVKA